MAEPVGDSVGDPVGEDVGDIVGVAATVSRETLALGSANAKIAGIRSKPAAEKRTDLFNIDPPLVCAQLSYRRQYRDSVCKDTEEVGPKKARFIAAIYIKTNIYRSQKC